MRLPSVVLRPEAVTLQPPQVLELHKDILGETIPCLVCPPFRHTAGRFLNSQTEVGTLPLVRPRIEVRTVTAPPTLLMTRKPIPVLFICPLISHHTMK